VENARLTDVPSLGAMARAHPGHRGASRLLAALTTHEPGTTLTRSELEERYRTLRFTHRRLTHDPRTVAATLEAALTPANPGTPIS
jgi:hypothetical protein